MTDRNGGSLIVETLREQGITCLFSVSGDAILSVYDACKDVGLPIYHTRQESAAVTMADGWTRTTGQPGVCVVTMGAGVANCMGGMLNAFLDQTPVVLIAGGSATSKWGRGAFAEIDATTYLRPVTKWSTTVFDVERIPELLLTALRHATSGRPGPVCLQIPSDVAMAAVSDGFRSGAGRRRSVANGQTDPAAISDAVASLRAAKRPMLIAGSGVWWSQATEALNKLVEAAQIPAFACYLGRGSLSHASPHYFGLATPSVNPVGEYAAAHCDLVLAVGAHFDFELQFGQVYHPDAKVIQIDADPTVVGHNRPADLGLVGDVRLVLEQLLNHNLAPGVSRAEWHEALREIDRTARDALQPALASEQQPIHPARLCREIREFLADDAVVTLGGGNIYSWGRTILDPRPPGRILAPHHTWALGCAVSLAAAAKVAHPERQVLALSGDGSLGYDLMELDTALRYALPLVCVVANDAGWSMMSSAQEKIFGQERVHAMELLATPYHEIVSALGGYGERVTEPREIQPALQRAFASGVPACLNVQTAPVHSPDLISWYG